MQPGHSGQTWAACVTGLKRTVLEWPVVGSFKTHLVGPHVQAGDAVDIFMVIIGAWSGEERVRIDAAIREMYQPTRLLLKRPQQLADLRTHRCSLLNRSHMDAYKSMTQWIGVRWCYQEVQAHERHRGREYDWIYRIRSDTVLLQDTPFASLSRTADATVLSDARMHVYVPLNGMSSAVKLSCQNDHLFVCPRNLCRPYFHLLELWQSEHCIPAPRHLVTAAALPVRLNAWGHSTLPGESIFRVAPNEPSGRDGPPAAPFWLPPLPLQHDAHWYFFARYSEGHSCGPYARVVLGQRDGEGESCCGLLREVLWAYSLAPEHAKAPPAQIQCAYRLSNVNPDALSGRERRAWSAKYIRTCEALRAAWRRDRNRSKGQARAVAAWTAVAGSNTTVWQCTWTRSMLGRHEYCHDRASIRDDRDLRCDRC